MKKVKFNCYTTFYMTSSWLHEQNGYPAHPSVLEVMKSFNLQTIQELMNCQSVPTLVCHRHNGCSPMILTCLYTSIIRPVLTFTHPVLANIPTNLPQNFEKTERRAMRLVYYLHSRHSSANFYFLLHVHIPTLWETLNT